MTANGVLQIVLYIVLLLATVKPLGIYMANVYEGRDTPLARVLRPVERTIFRLCGVSSADEMGWRDYAGAVILFALVCVLSLYALLRLNAVLPLNAEGFAPMPPDLALHTAVSFVTNTNWQNYGGEATLGYLPQMAGLTVQNFLSAGAGMAICVALIRGFSRHNARAIGNFWVDMTRGVLYILLPLALMLALVLVSQGAVQTLSGNLTVPLLQPGRDAQGNAVTQQVIAVGPAASQVAIKHLGTNGGGFFNANAAHPFENPTPVTDLLLTLAQSCIPAAFTYTFGRMVGDQRQGWAILAAMLIILVSAIFGAYAAESAGNPRLAALGVDQTASESQPGGNMEGKEARFGIARSALFATLTTATSSGAVNAMHDSFTPLGGMVLMVMMMLGETVLGGAGSGLYGMLVFAIVTVFISGLMVGRTPEYLGKKVEAYEMKMASLVMLLMPMVVLGFTAAALLIPAGKVAAAEAGPHGFSEILYAFTSQGNNNGSAFAGLAGNTPFYNLAGAAAMFFGRFWIAVPTLALAGSLARKKRIPASAGTLPTHTPLFIVFLICVVAIVGALTFLPALALGPLVEHLRLWGQGG